VIRIGILGTASIARLFFGAPLSRAAIVAVASRDAGRAQEFARHYHIPRSYGTYEELLADPGIDAVYIPLPQHLHHLYTIRAAEAGKHVLVEKPAAVSSAEIEQMISACCASRVLLMEGFYREILAGAPRDVALQRAQARLARSEKYAHPFFWAPFIIVGDNGMTNLN